MPENNSIEDSNVYAESLYTRTLSYEENHVVLVLEREK